MPRWPSAMPLALLAAVAGCSKLPKDTSLLSANPTPDHVALEVFFVRVPAHDRPLLDPLWSVVDEQAIPLEMRRRWSANGFMAGMIGGQLPTAVTTLLQVSDDAPTPAAQKPSLIDFTKPPRIHRKLIDVYQTETPSRIVVTGERERHARFDVLFRDEGDEGMAVRGWTFTNARGILLAKVHPQPDGRVKLEIVPEVEHGQARRETKLVEGGAFAVEITPPRKTFDSLRLWATLSPGEMLVFGCQADRPGSLGQQFFTERQSDLLSQTVLLIRLVQTKPDDLFTNAALEGE